MLSDIEELSQNQTTGYHLYYTWRDWLMGGYFTSVALLGLVSLGGEVRFSTYSVCSIIVGVIGLLAVTFKLKHVEAVMIVTWGLLLAARSILLIVAMPDGV